jgi:hypothetical protein
LAVKNNVVFVAAPGLQASLPPAIHTDQRLTLSVRGWARRSPAGLLAGLEQAITPTLSAFANDPRRIALVREECRKSVGDFVRLWLEREGQWGAAGFNRIEIQFADELARSPATAIAES